MKKPYEAPALRVQGSLEEATHGLTNPGLGLGHCIGKGLGHVKGKGQGHLKFDDCTFS